MTIDGSSPWLTVKQVAARAQCGPRLVYRAIRSGRLRAATIGARRDYRVHATWADAWLEALSTPTEVRPLREVRR